MGNRAAITNKFGAENPEKGIGVYLHWNGGLDSVETFCKYCKLKGVRGVDSDPQYGFARLIQVIGNFFGGTTSIGVDVVANLDCDNYDNGVYVIDDDWEIVERLYMHAEEQRHHDMNEMLKHIDSKMPEDDRIGGIFDAKIKNTKDISIGDRVYVFDNVCDVYELGSVVGFGHDEFINGHRVNGVPFVSMYGDNEEEYRRNVNNYLFKDSYYVKSE